MAWHKYMYASPRSSPPTCCVTCVIFYIALHDALVLNACKSVAWCFPFYNFALSTIQCNVVLWVCNRFAVYHVQLGEKMQGITDN